jgi:hypothetical protein
LRDGRHARGDEGFSGEAAGEFSGEVKREVENQRSNEEI